MKCSTRLTIPKRIRPAPFIGLVLILPFFQAWLPGWVKYLMDVAWVILAVFLVCFWSVTYTGHVSGPALWVLTFLGLALAVYLVQFQSMLYFLWGFRNHFRFFGAFFAFALFLSREDIRRTWMLYDRLFWINAAVTLLQFFRFGLRGDYLGGLFGTAQGCNGATNLFLIIMAAKSIAACMDGKESSVKCFGKCLASLLVAALAELKFFFVEFVLILLLAVLFSGISRRKLGFLLLGFIGAAVFAALLSRVFPIFDGWFSFKRMLQTATSPKGYASAGDLNRLTAISEINRRVFGSGWQQLFGLGLGNCDYASFPFLTTPFYRDWKELHYTWMSVPFWYLETGWLGLVFFFGFFVLVFLRARRERCTVAQIVAVLCPLIAIYNASLRTETAYILYFVLALPFGSGKYDESYCKKRVS